MKSKLSFPNVLIVSVTLAAIALGCAFVYFGAKDTPYKHYEQYKAQNNCPYEGTECPNAQAVLEDWHEEQLDHIAELREYDSVFVQMHNEIVELKTQLAGYEFQDHSRLVSH